MFLRCPRGHLLCGVPFLRRIPGNIALGEYLYDFPAALIFFYVAGPAIVVNVAFGSWVRGNIRRLLPEV